MGVRYYGGVGSCPVSPAIAVRRKDKSQTDAASYSTLQRRPFHLILRGLSFYEKFDNNKDKPAKRDQRGQNKNNRSVAPPFQFVVDVIHPPRTSRKGCDWFLILNAR
jgi:hypothetical protein